MQMRLLLSAAALIAAATASSSAFSSQAPLSLSVLNTVTSKPSDTFRYIGVNMDFWPSTKDKWEGAGALVLNLTQPDLHTLAAALNGSVLRLGGSPADFLLYDVDTDACSLSNLNRTQQPVGSYFCPIWEQVVGQCLEMERYTQLNMFALNAGLHLILDLNACWGRNSSVSDMDWSQIDGLFNYTYGLYMMNQSAIYGFEFGNEVYTNVNASVYGASMLRMSQKLDEQYGASNPSKPKLIGPDCWENDLTADYYTSMLTSAQGSMHAVTIHDYADDCCVATDGNVLNMTCLDAFIDGAVWVQNVTQPFIITNGLRVWNGEMAMHSSSGIDGLTNTFVSSLFYINALASYASAGLGLVSRQTFQGGDYELINKTTLLPNPDYYALLLWRSVVGDGGVLALGGGGGAVHTLDGSVRGYAFCGINSNSSGSSSNGAAVVVLVNFGINETTSVNIDWPAADSASLVEVFQLTGVEGFSSRNEEEENEEQNGMDSPSSSSSSSVPLPPDWPANNLRRVALNGRTLVFTNGGQVPALIPLTQPATQSIKIPPISITFVVRTDAGASAC